MSLEDLLDSENQYHTVMGKAFPMERVVFRGHDLHVDLKDFCWMKTYVFGITGKKLTDAQIDCLNTMWVFNSYPDPRIWSNRLLALAASARSTVGQAFAAGTATFEASFYGTQPCTKGVDFFLRAGKAIDNGISLEEFLDMEAEKYKVIPAFGRVMIKQDERVPHFSQYLQESGFINGKHVSLAFEMEKILRERKNISMNIAALFCSIGADFGFSPREFQVFISFLSLAGMPPCYIEAYEKPEGCFFPIRCDNVKYIGDKKKRTLPKRYAS